MAGETRDGASRGERMLAGLLEASHHAAPHEIGALVADAATGIGAVEVVIFLADYQQVELRPLFVEGLAERPPQEIDSTPAGRAYRVLELLEDSDQSVRRLWVPLLNGSERLGVLELTFPDTETLDEQRYSWSRHLAALVAELIMAKSSYGDVFELARRRAQVSIASELQHNLLPPLTLITNQIVLAAALEPAYDTAGDAFDYAVNPEKTHFIVVDGMGHGLEAALLASVAIASYRHARRAGLGLVETYAQLDATIADQFGHEHFVTALLAELDLQDGTMQILNAGHPPPLLLHNGTLACQLRSAPTLPAGMHDGDVSHQDVQVTEEVLQPGDRLLAFTDGVVDARSPQGEPFGVQRLADLLEREMTAEEPASETMRRMTRQVVGYQDGRPQDDATLLLLQRRGPTAGD